MRLYRRAVVVFSIVIAVLGVGAPRCHRSPRRRHDRLLIGGLFVALGVARFTLERKRGPL